jgi:two-component system cell cycle response regulator CtrA
METLMRLIMHDQNTKRQELLHAQFRSSCMSVEIIPLESLSAGISGMEEMAAEFLPIVLGFEPGYDALGFVRQLRGFGSRSPLIILQSGLDPEQVGRLIDAGADDVVTGTVSSIEVAARVRAVARRQFGVRTQSVKLGPLTVYLDGRDPEIDGQTVKLAPCEKSILSMLSCNAGKVVRREAIFDTLYTLSDYQPHMKAVDIHIHKLRKKLFPDSGKEGGMIRTYSGQGYCLDVAEGA